MHNSSRIFCGLKQCYGVFNHHYNNQIIMKTEMSTQLPSIMAMWKFFNENLHFKLSKYEFTEGGITVMYVVMDPEQLAESIPERFS